jgi:hypothetical protein
VVPIMIYLKSVATKKETTAPMVPRG